MARLLFAFFAVALLWFPAAMSAADAPAPVLDETVTEYDVDPSWPKRPEHVKPFGWVSGLAIDAHNNVWLFNKGPDPIQVYTTSGEFVRTWGQDQFKEPHQLRIDHEGNVWLADFGLHVVRKYSPDGKMLAELGTIDQPGEDTTHFNRPTDMAITPAGDVFITDGYGNRRVVHYDKTGKFVKAWGKLGTDPGNFVLPHAIVVDAKGTLYVADRNSGRIELFDQSGKLLDQWSNLIMPWGLSINAQGDLWVCGSSPHWWVRDGKAPEFKDQIFVRFSPEGRAEQVWSIPLFDRTKAKETPKGSAIGVHCIAEDRAGNLFVGDIYSEQAQKFVPVRTPSPGKK